MILKLFQLAISLNLLFASCHDNFTPQSFEEADDSLVEFINENFLEKNISFFPTKNIIKLDSNLSAAKVILKEPTKLSSMLAFNLYNDLIGNFFYDYNINGDEMSFVPYEARAKYKDIYFGISIKVEGFLESNSKENTFATITLTNYTPWVKEYIKCKDRR